MGFFCLVLFVGEGTSYKPLYNDITYSEKLMHGTELWIILASLFLSMYFQHLVEYYYTIKAPNTYIRRCIHPIRSIEIACVDTAATQISERLYHAEHAIIKHFDTLKTCG